MLGYDKLLEEIEQLSYEERQALLAHLLESLHEEGQQESGRKSLLPLQGCLRSEGSLPTDDDLRADYTDYLTRKYS